MPGLSNNRGIAQAEAGVEGKESITELVLERLIFKRRWFAWLDNYVDQDPRRRQGIGKAIFYVPFVASIVILHILGVLDTDQLVGRREYGKGKRS